MEINDFQSTIKSLQEGGVILHETDSIPGLGCMISNIPGLHKIYKLKKRGMDMPLLILCADLQMAETVCGNIPDSVKQHFQSKQTRPETIVVPNHNPDLPELLVGPRKTIAFRIPISPKLRRLVAETGPLVSTSANISSEPSPLTIFETNEEIKDGVDLISGFRIDDINSFYTRSEIIDFTENEPKVLREIGENLSTSVLLTSGSSTEHLKNCIESLKKFSYLRHQILVHIDDRSKKLIDWLMEKNIDFIQSKGVVNRIVATNLLSERIKAHYTIFGSHSYFFLPGWDLPFAHSILQESEEFLLSPSLLKPNEEGPEFGFPSIDFGGDILKFKEKELIAISLEKGLKDWSGFCGKSALIKTSTWKEMGGLDESYKSLFYAGTALGFKLWKKGLRNFKGLGNAHIYQMNSEKPERLQHDRAHFLKEEKILASTFHRHYLKTGKEWTGPLESPSTSSGFLVSQIKDKITDILTNTPETDEV